MATPLLNKIEFPVLFDDGNHTTWRKDVNYCLSRFSIAGKAVLTGRPLYPRLPRYDDMMLDASGVATSIQKYEHTAPIFNGDGVVTSPWAFTSEGLKDFKRASNLFPSEVAQFNLGNDKLADFIITHLGSDVKKELYSTPTFVVALHKEITDTFAMLDIIRDMYSKGTSRTKIKCFKTFLGISQGDLSHAAYMETVKDQLAITKANFASPGHLGHMDLDLMGVIIYLGGLNMAHFQPKYDAFIAGDASRSLDTINLSDLMLDFNTYYREKDTSPLNYVASFTAAADTALAVATVASASPGTTKCVTCSGPTTIDPRTGKSFSRCLPCSRDFMSKKRAQGAQHKPGPIIAKPTSAQLLHARAMVAAADAVSTPAQALLLARSLVAAADAPLGLQAGLQDSGAENPFDY
jgi:hypothetical protein